MFYRKGRSPQPVDGSFENFAVFWEVLPGGRQTTVVIGIC